MKTPADDIPPYVGELFAAERQAPRPSLEVERRVRGRLAVTLAATAAGTASLAASSVAAATAAGAAKAGGLALGIKVSLVVVGVSVVGTAGGMAWHHHKTVKSQPPAVHVAASHRRAAPAKAAARPLAVAPEMVAPVAAPPTELPAPAEPTRDEPAAPAASALRTSVVRATHAREAPAQIEPDVLGNLAQESPLIERARASIASKHPAHALSLLAEHSRRFPLGQLEEEREALWVQALVASGGTEAARARAESFRRRFPRSIQLPIVEAAAGPMK